ncbi:DNA cytosine methyltransferase [Streptomyces olivaceoviridis]|uniref:DNA cytosine methyltransferase n=1 Tax=Streptomyces olivaceoviridis TaxID=1921 RepID=UPI0036F8DDB2
MSGPTSTHLFSGGCGDLLGYRDAGLRPVFAANHDEDAVATVRANFAAVHAKQCDINNLDFRSLPRTDILVGSPICTEISPAGRNATPREQDSLDEDFDDGRPKPPDFSRTRATAWDLIRADEVHDYDYVCGENVVDFATRWRLFDAWLNVWDALGKNVQVVSVNAAHIGGAGNDPAPQLRNRVVFCFSKRGLPLPDLRPRPACICLECGPVRGIQRWGRRFDKKGVRKAGSYGLRQQYVYICPTPRCHRQVEPVVRSIREYIDWSVPGQRFGDGKPNRKAFEAYGPETTRKVRLGLEKFGDEPFIVILRRNCTVQSLDEPVSTITTGNHHLLVRPGATLGDSEVRQLTVRERARAQRFPDSHVFAGDSETSLKRQVGNAVPVNLGHWVGERVMASLTEAA